MTRVGLLAGLLLLGPLSARASDSSRLSVAVLDLAPQGVPAELAASVTGLVAGELERLRVFAVVSRQDVRALLSHALQSEALGCEGEACSAHVGNMLGVRFLVSGSVGRVGDRYALTVTLSDVARSEVVGRSAESSEEAGRLTQMVARAVRAMAAPVLAARQAPLLLSCAEGGAVVSLDGQVVGTTPLPQRPVSWGPHLLEVRKDGFISAVEEFTVLGPGLVERPVTLVPSPDFLETYEGHARRMRWGAWLTTGAAAVGLGAFAFLQSGYLAGAARFEAGVAAYEAAGRTPPLHAALAQQRLQLDDQLLMTRIAAAGALVMGGAATAFWVAGPDPERYARYRGAATSASAEPVPAASAEPPRLALQWLGPGGLVSVRGSLP